MLTAMSKQMHHNTKNFPSIPGRRQWLAGAGAAALAQLTGCAAPMLADGTPMPGRLGVADMARAVAAGRIGDTALVEQVLGRIRATGGEGARVFAQVHAGQARATAQAIAQRRRQGGPLPVLAGVPVAVQDVIDEAGQRTTASSPALQHAALAARDAEAVRRLRDAGAVLIGRTRGSDMGWPGLGLNPAFPLPRNAFERGAGRVAGGGASGSAVAVADGMASAAIGNDLGGGVRLPAALNGLVGWRPSRARVPRDGLLPLSSTLDALGVVAGSVGDCMLVDGVLAGQPALAPSGPLLRGLRLAVPTTLVLDDLAFEVAHPFRLALARLTAAGASVVELPVPALAQLGAVDARLLAGGEAHAAHRALFDAGQAQMDAALREALRAGGAVPAAARERRLAQRAEAAAAVTQALTGYDAWLLPTTTDVAPLAIAIEKDAAAHDRLRTRMLRNPMLVDLLDACALTLPCQAGGTAPVGLTVAGPAGADARILAVGRTIEGVVTARG